MLLLILVLHTIVSISGVPCSLPANGWAGQGQLQNEWRRFSQSEKRNSAAAEKSEFRQRRTGSKRGRAKIPFPRPFPFLPARA